MKASNVIELNTHILSNLKLFIFKPSELPHPFHSSFLPSDENNSKNQSKRDSIKKNEAFLHVKL